MLLRGPLKYSVVPPEGIPVFFVEPDLLLKAKGLSYDTLCVGKVVDATEQSRHTLQGLLLPNLMITVILTVETVNLITHLLRLEAGIVAEWCCALAQGCRADSC